MRSGIAFLFLCLFSIQIFASNLEFSRFSILAERQLNVGPHTVILSGDIGANAFGGFVNFGTGVLVNNQVTAFGDYIKLGCDTRLAEVYSSYTPLLPKTPLPSGCLAPIYSWHAYNPPRPAGEPLVDDIPIVASYSPGSTDIAKIPRGATVNIAPGAYRKLNISSNATAYFAPGTYEFYDLKLWPGASIRANGPIKIKVTHKLVFSSESFVGPALGSGISFEDIQIFQAGKSVVIARKAHLMASVIAPVSRIKISDGAAIQGRVYGDTISIKGLCHYNLCGNGTINAGEQCDLNSDLACPGKCQNNCLCGTEINPPPPNPPTCGDGKINVVGEECDDGNLINGDGCSSSCKNENPPKPICGDGAINLPGEQCDDGNLIDGDGCSHSCKIETPPPVPVCGDGVINLADEQCDDGNLVSGDGCSSSCKIELPPSTIYCSYTQGGWGTTCQGSNPGCKRDALFGSKFPNGLRIGDLQGPDGSIGGYTSIWQTSLAVENYLPAGGTAGPLVQDLSNPLVTPAGVLAGQLVAAKLNRAAFNLGSFKISTTRCSFSKAVKSYFNGMTVDQVISLADEAVGKGLLPPSIGYSDISTALDALNNNYDNCTQNLGCLAR